MSTRLALALGCALVIAACGGGSHSHRGSKRHRGPAQPTVVDVYSSLPSFGPSAAAAAGVAQGIKLALSQSGYRAGDYTIRYRALDDATAAAGGSSATQTAVNARRVASDPAAVLYIGDFDSEADEVSIPILDAAGVPIVNPASTYVGLTEKVPNVTGGTEPNSYYPGGVRNFVRLIPNDAVQAAADLMELKALGCDRVAVASDAESYGAGFAGLLGLQKSYYGVSIVGQDRIVPGPTARSLGVTVRGQGAQCVELTGLTSAAMVEAAGDVHAVVPSARILAPDPLCQSDFTNPRDDGLPVGVAPFFLCTRATLSVTAYPGGPGFAAAYRAAYHGAEPSSYALLGYEAMQLGIDTIRGVGLAGDDRGAVLRALFGMAGRDSVLGLYGFDRLGDTTLRSIGLYKVGPGGDPLFDKKLDPSRVYAASGS